MARRRTSGVSFKLCEELDHPFGYVVRGRFRGCLPRMFSSGTRITTQNNVGGLSEWWKTIKSWAVGAQQPSSTMRAMGGHLAATEKKKRTAKQASTSRIMVDDPTRATDPCLRSTCCFLRLASLFVSFSRPAVNMDRN